MLVVQFVIFSPLLTLGTPLPKVTGLKFQILDDGSQSVSLTWDPVQDQRSKKWTYGVYYGTKLSELLVGKWLL